MSDAVDSLLAHRLRAVGLDPVAVRDPAAAWRRVRDRFGGHVTLLDRYALEAVVRRIDVEELDEETRTRLGREVLAVQFPGLELRPEAERHDGPVEVVPYDPAWASRFEEWRIRLADAIGPAARRIEHVGSTSVPGLAAKPIIDIQVSVDDPEDEASYVSAIERCGLVLRSREPGHRYFRPPAGRGRDVHVHVCAVGSPWQRAHLLFRDYLRAHPAVRDAYAVLKRDLARHYAADRLAYTDAKSAFVLDALDAAAEWAHRTGWQVS